MINFSVINVWTTDPNRNGRKLNQPISTLHHSSNNSQQSAAVHKFGITKPTFQSAVGLGSHKGKYTPNSLVSDLAQR